MKQYVSRRRRCWTLLVQMDPVIEGHRSDMQLDLSGLTREERVMVQASSEDGEEALDCDDDEENYTFFSYVALDDVTVGEAAELDAIALLADTCDTDLDFEVSAQLVQANVQAYLSFGKEKGEGKGQGQGQGQIPCSCITFVTGGSSTTIVRTESGN